MKKHWLIGLAAVATLVASSVPASAQTFKPGERQKRPDWGIFMSGVSTTEQRLVLNGLFGGGFEDDLTKPLPPPINPGEAQPLYAGPFGSVGASLSYSVDKQSVVGDVQVGAFGRNYRDMTDPFVGTYSASGNLNFALSKKSSLGTTAYGGQYIQNLAPMGYNPAGGFGIPGAPAVPGDPGVYTNGDTYHSMGASAMFNHKFTTKWSMKAGYAYYINDAWADEESGSKYDSQYATAGMRYELGKGIGLRGGYGLTVAGFLPSAATQTEGRVIDAGVDYNKSLSPSRKSTLTFSTGITGVLDQGLGKTQYYFVGNVQYMHEIGRTWTTWASVNRGVNFYSTLGRPVVEDAMSAGMGGLIGRRVNVTSGISVYRGSSIGESSGKVYDSMNLMAGVQVALNRVMAAGVDYSYYHYRFTNDVQDLPPGFLRQTDRQSIRVSLSVWAPLITQARRTNASR